MTEEDLSAWLDSDKYMAAAVECSSDENPVQVVPLQDFPSYPPFEVQQLELAVRSGDRTSIETILRQWHECPEDKRTNIDLFASAYALAMDTGDVAVASYLMKQGVHINRSHFWLAMEKKSYSFLQCFLDHGFDINQPWSYISPAALADTFEDETMMQWFIEHEADPNAESGNDTTPLSYALKAASFHIIKLLFKYGGPESIQHGQLLHHAVHRQSPDYLQVLQYLLEQGAQCKINELKYQSRQDLFESEGLIVGCGTPLHEAAKSGRLDVVKLLVAQGADPLVRDSKGRLVVEAAQGHDHVVEYLIQLPSLSRL